MPHRLNMERRRSTDSPLQFNNPHRANDRYGNSREWLGDSTTTHRGSIRLHGGNDRDGGDRNKAVDGDVPKCSDVPGRHGAKGFVKTPPIHSTANSPDSTIASISRPTGASVAPDAELYTEFQVVRQRHLR